MALIEEFMIFDNAGNINKDSDHDALGIWQNIKCHCRGQQTAIQCDTTGNNRKARDELIMMRMCGNKDGTYNGGDNFDPVTQFYVYSAYVRKGDYKLVVKYSCYLSIPTS